MSNSASNPTVYEVRDVASTIATLRALGVRVEANDQSPSVDFTEIATRSVLMTLGWIKILTTGEYVVSLHSMFTVHQVAALERVVSHFLTGSTGHANWRRGVEDDGSHITVLMAPVSVEMGLHYLEAATLLDQVDKPGACRTCGRGVRTYKLGEGGWVCGRCRVEPTTLRQFVNRQVIQTRSLAGEWSTRAEAASRIGDVETAERLTTQAARVEGEAFITRVIQDAAEGMDRAKRRAARRASKAARVNA